MVVTHYFLVGAGLPCRQLEVLPSQDEEQEEGQHEELPVPHCHQEDLRRRRNKISNGLKHSLDLVKSLADGYRFFALGVLKSRRHLQQLLISWNPYYAQR